MQLRPSKSWITQQGFVLAFRNLPSPHPSWVKLKNVNNLTKLAPATKIYCHKTYENTYLSKQVKGMYGVRYF